MIKHKFIVFPVLFICIFLGLFATYTYFSKSKNNLPKSVVESHVDKNALFNQLILEYPRMYNKLNYTTSNTIATSDKYGYIATDGYSITHKYDDKLKKLVPLVPAISNGKSIKTRMVNILKKLAVSKITRSNNNKNNIQVNPLSIDKTDIDQYVKTGSDTSSKSFKFIYNSKKQPVLIVAIKTIPETSIATMVATLQKAVSVLEQYDPEILNRITTEYLVHVVTGPIYPDNLLRKKSSAFASIGAIQYNANLIGSDTQYYIYSLAMHSRYIGSYKSSKKTTNNTYVNFISDHLDNDPLVDQVSWGKNWIYSHQNDIFKNDYLNFINSTKLPYNEK